MKSDIFLNAVEKLKKDKKLFTALVIGLSGLLLILISEVTPKDKETFSQNEAYFAMTDDELCSELEDIIEKISGAGKTKVMVTYKGSYETIYASNIQQRDKNGEQDKEREYIIIDTDQGEGGLKIKVLSPEIKGVAVVCQGGDSPMIKEQIISILSALFDISSNKISVATMAK